MPKENRTGSVLVATPNLNDSVFSRSIVLLLKDEPEGAMGLVLNQPTGQTRQEIFQTIYPGKQKPQKDEPLFFGGPLYGPLMAVHTLKSASEKEVLPGLYWCNEKENLVKLIKSERPYRIFAGYAGWGEDQLDYELKQGRWTEINKNRLTDHSKQHSLVFHEPYGKVWKTARAIYGEIWMELMGIKHPQNVECN